MNVAWAIGFLFTMGILMDGDDGQTPWYITILCVAMCFITWPMCLGHMCAKFFVEKKGGNK